MLLPRFDGGSHNDPAAPVVVELQRGPLDGAELTHPSWVGRPTGGATLQGHVASLFDNPESPMCVPQLVYLWDGMVPGDGDKWRFNYVGLTCGLCGKWRV